MADLSKLIETVVSGVVSGGASALTAILAVLRDFRNRLQTLEAKVGTAEPKTGLYLALSLIEEPVKKMRREMDAWEDDPPDWAKRLLAKARTNSSTDLSGQIHFEDRVDRTLKEFRERIKRIEDQVESELARLEREVGKQQADTKLVTREEYLRDSQQRAEEMHKVREQLATANGLLRGVMSALGYIDTDKPKYGR